MWHTLKADLDYYKFSLLIGMSIGVLIAIVLLALGFADLNILMTNSFFVYFINIGIIGADADKDKRNRHDTLLPLSIRETAVSRMLFVIFFQLGLLLLWLIFLMFSGEEITTRTICRLFSANAMNLAIVALFVIHHDLGFLNGKKYLYGFLGLIFIVAGLLAYFGKMRAVWGFIFDTLYPSPAGALLFSLIAAGLYFLSIHIFVRRKSYLA